MDAPFRESQFKKVSTSTCDLPFTEEPSKIKFDLGKQFFGFWFKSLITIVQQLTSQKWGFVSIPLIKSKSLSGQPDEY